MMYLPNTEATKKDAAELLASLDAMQRPELKAELVYLTSDKVRVSGITTRCVVDWFVELCSNPNAPLPALTGKCHMFVKEDSEEPCE